MIYKKKSNSCYLNYFDDGADEVNAEFLNWFLSIKISQLKRWASTNLFLSIKSFLFNLSSPATFLWNKSCLYKTRNFRLHSNNGKCKCRIINLNLFKWSRRRIRRYDELISAESFSFWWRIGYEYSKTGCSEIQELIESQFFWSSNSFWITTEKYL